LNFENSNLFRLPAQSRFGEGWDFDITRRKRLRCASDFGFLNSKPCLVPATPG
jgi:hypothetical protein